MSKKLAEFRALSAEELNHKIVELRTDLAKEKAQASSGTKAHNPGKIGKTKKTIARFLTILKEKSLSRNLVKKSKEIVAEKPKAENAAEKKTISKDVKAKK